METLDIAIHAIGITFAVSPAFYSNSVNPYVFFPFAGLPKALEKEILTEEVTSARLVNNIDSHGTAVPRMAEVPAPGSPECRTRI
jgi:hypothetical protein